MSLACFRYCTVVCDMPSNRLIFRVAQDKANVLIREDITKYYDANKNTMESKDILTLLSFADTHVHLLRKFGIDTSSGEYVFLQCAVCRLCICVYTTLLVCV